MGAGLLQTSCESVHRRPGCNHIVNDYDVTTDRGTCLECTRDVRAPRGRVGQ